jgi:hypothetical protein
MGNYVRGSSISHTTKYTEILRLKFTGKSTWSRATLSAFASSDATNREEVHHVSTAHRRLKRRSLYVHDDRGPARRTKDPREIVEFRLLYAYVR